MSGLDTVLSRFPGAKPAGDGYLVSCPTSRHGRGDKRPGLKIDVAPDGTVLLHCHGGCDPEMILSAVGLTLRDLFPDRRNEKGGGGSGIPPNQTATVQPFDGCTLAEYAAGNKIPEQALRGFRVSQISYLGVQALRIPYVGTDFEEAAVRFRVSLTGEDKFRWRKGSKPALYGLWRLRAAIELGFVVLVEGESDCHTLWWQQFPAVGLPGASNWKDERDAAHFEKIEAVYIIREPDTGGDAVEKWLSTSKIRAKARMVSLGDLKDPSGLYLDDPERFRERFQAALDAAIPWTDIQTADAEDRQRSAWVQCAKLAHEPSILDRFAEALPRAGVAGERRTAQILYLVITSRLLARPASAVVKAPSSAGKSYVSERVLAFFPPAAYYALSSMSERALAYSEEPLSHRVLVIYEAAGLAGDFATYLVRSLLSEGKIRYETVEKTRDGLKPKLIEREGPTSLLMTTTQVKIHPENETRVLSLAVTDTPDQTRAVLRRIADDEPAEPLDLAPWHALQEWLSGDPAEVSVPFARPLAEMVPPVAVRLRRDFGMLLTLVRTHALLHRASRDVDDRGRIVATLTDYAAVRELVADLVADGVEASVSATVRETVTAIKELIDGGLSEVQVVAVARVLKLDKATTWRRIHAALEHGYLKNLEDRKGRPARLVIGEPMPEDSPILPTVEALRERLHGCSGNGGDTYAPSPPTAEYFEDAPPPRCVRVGCPEPAANGFICVGHLRGDAPPAVMGAEE